MKVSSKALISLNWSLIMLAIFIYFLNNFFLKSLFPYSLFKFYLNDFLYILLLNSITFLSLFKLYSRKMPWKTLFVANFVVVSVSFELIFPLISADQTPDILDCIAYFCGLGIYLILFAIYDANDLLQIRRRKA